MGLLPLGLRSPVAMLPFAMLKLLLGFEGGLPGEAPSFLTMLYTAFELLAVEADSAQKL